MDALHQLEVLWILFVQSLGAWLREPLGAISLLGQEDFYMLVMPILYWSLDSVLGFRVAVMLLLSNGLNAVLKMALASPRPYWFDPQIPAFAEETSFGLPSGHAQNAASIWGLIAASIHSKTGKFLLVLLIFLIGFSRIYLGVHFISDVLLGWLVGGLLLWLFLKLEKPIWNNLRVRPLAQLIGIAAVTSVLLGGMVLLAASARAGWLLPEMWQQNALRTQPENILDPLNIEGAFTLGGTWMGLMAGAAWLYRRQGGFHTIGTPTQRLLRYIVGVAGIFVFWYLLGSIFPREANAMSYALRYLRYVLVGLWISALAPLLFARLGLATSRTPAGVPLPSTENPL
jgi:membrane-associated phospholipid phosphatase